MSAIFGLIHQDGRPVAGRELDLMGSALAAHGPDGNGSGSWGHIGLGHRLMCFTPEDRLERQPLLSRDGHHALVFDGRLDNRPELIRALGIRQGESGELPDSAFVLRAYERWGIGCREQLVGDFAFALYDSREGHVVIVRTPMSTRSLFYHHAAAGRFAFSSAPKGLFALSWVPREIDQQTLADHLTTTIPDSGRSFYGGLRELEGGDTLIVRREGFRLERHWRPDLGHEIRFPRDSDYPEAFNEIFDRVIASQLRSLTPVGAQLSGGLDSSSIAVTAAGILSREGKRLATFTEVPRPGFKADLPDYWYPDETDLVRAIARKYDHLDLNFIRAGGQFPLDGIGSFFDAQEGLFPATWNRLWWEGSLRCAWTQDVRVVLTGLPGNLTMTPYGDLIPQLIRKGMWLRALREARACSTRDGGPSTLWALARGTSPLLPTWAWRAAERFLHPDDPDFRANPPWLAYSPVRSEFARAQRVKERTAQRGAELQWRPGLGTPEERYRELRDWHNLPHANRGYEAMLQVQTRNPSGDVRIAEFCLALPEEQHQRDGVSRRLIRRAMKDRLPAEVLANRRRGVQAADWVEGVNRHRPRLFDELERIEHSSLAREALDLNLARRLLREMPESGNATGPVSIRYGHILGSAFMTGSFLHWFEFGSQGSGNTRPSALKEAGADGR